MKHTLVIASRELRANSRLFAAVAGMSLLPFLAMIMPRDRQAALAAAAGLFALVVSFGTSIMFGVSTIVGDLVERRLSFYFSKPVSPAALWFGKLIAALLTSLVCFAVILGVSAPFAGREFLQIWNSTAFAFAGSGIVLLFLISHTLSTMVRSRSALIGLDFLLMAVSLVAIFYIVRPLLLAGATLGFILLGIIGGATILTLLFAPLWQLERGRSDIKRSHAALSRAIWTSAAVVLVLAGAYAAWVVRVAPRDLTRILNVEQSPAGNAIFVTGTTPARADYRASYLVDLDSGRYQRVDTLPWWGVRYSDSGNAVAWMEPTSLIKPAQDLELYTKRLDQPNAQAVATGIRRSIGSDFALSPDGTRIAVASGQTLAVQDVASQRILASVPRGGGAFTVEVYFATSDVVRVHQTHHGSPVMEIYELDIPSKKFEKTGEVTADRTYMNAHVSRDASRIYMPRSGIVADARTGAIVTKLPLVTPSHVGTAILSDGTIAVTKHAKGAPQVTLSLFAPDGTLKHEVALPGRLGWLSGEVEGGKLIVMNNEGPNTESGRGFHMYVVDIASGTIERTMNDLSGPAPSFGSPRLARFRADAKLAAVNAEGKLVTWNPTTGAVTPLK